ncbi:MAG TPA: sigma-70 family RNA polymerase sigma factor [Thermoleophilia bacterium]|nr:sigma-70 family RNA polymerase sigma factor [Thermoleophilia bacterium]
MTTRAATVPSPPDPATLVADYGRLVSSLCWRMTRDREVAREAAQEVWLAVLEGLPRFRGEASVSTWIYAIARRVIGGYAAAQRTYSVRFLSTYFEGEGEPAPPEIPDLDHDLWVRSMCDQCLCGMLQCLEPDPRLAFLLRDIAGLGYDDVARVLEVEPAAARQMVSRARRKLDRFLKGHCALAHPDGPCRCRMRRRVEAIDLPAEYARLRVAAGRARVFKDSEQVLPAKDYWLELSQTAIQGHQPQ